MAINQDILNPNTNWEDKSKGYIEDGLKELLRAMLAVLENPTIAAGSVGVSQLTQALRDIIDGKVPNTRKVNNKPLSSDVTIGAGDINVDSNTTLAQKLAELANLISSDGYDDAELRGYINTINGILGTQVIKSISVNGTAQSKDTNGNVNIVVPSGGLTESDISVETQGDGTVDINVGSNTYTINLNHTHENMAKLVVCEESDLPSTLDPATIYAITDSGETEIEKLIIRGMEFAGGGLPAGTPQITSPKSTIPFNLGTAYGQGGATGTVQVKGKNLTANSSLTVSVGSGFSLSYGQQSGSSITIDAADATIGADVDVFATANGTSGTLLITSQTDNINHSVELTSNVPEDLLAVKLTGTQWLQTDYCPKPNTRFEFDCKFIKNTYSSTGTGNNKGSFFGCLNDSATKVFSFNNGSYYQEGQINKVYSIYAWTESPYTEGGSIYSHIFNNEQTFCQRSVLNYSNGSVSFLGSTWTCESRTSTSSNPLCIGYDPNNDVIYGNFDLEIYGLKLYDGSTLVHDFKPVAKNGIAGLLDEVSGTFISSETNTELVAIPLT